MNPKKLAVVALVLSASCGAGQEQPETITGLVDATEIDISSKVPGRIKDVMVREGDHVQAGQPLAEIESEEIGAKLRQANAAIAATEAKLRMARSGARIEDREAASSQREAAQAQLDLAEKTLARMQELREKGSIPQLTFDEAESKFKLAKEQLAVAETRLQLAQHGSRIEEIQALEALVQQSEGLVAEVQSYQHELVQSAPVSAEVSDIVLHKGELAATGYPIVTLVDLDDIWVTFPVREDLLGNVRQGSEIEVEVPALGKRVKLKVFNLAVMGDFATWKATREKGGFDLKSFEVKARPVEKVEGLRPGMTVRWQPHQ